MPPQYRVRAVKVGGADAPARECFSMERVGGRRRLAYFVPGSHKQRVDFPIPQDPHADLPGAVELYTSAGSALFFEALLHVGSANRRGTNWRLAIDSHRPSFVEHWDGYRLRPELGKRMSGDQRQHLGGGILYPAPEPTRASAA